MEKHNETGPSGTGGGQNTATEKAKPRRHAGRLLGIFVLVLVLLALTARAFLPLVIRAYVNRTLDRNLLYEGRIGPVEVHLWRGAYSLRDVQISKRTGNVPVPLFSAKRVDFSVQWNALVHGRVVGRFLIQQPELNFVAGETED